MGLGDRILDGVMILFYRMDLQTGFRGQYMDCMSPPWAGRPDSGWSDDTILPDGSTDWISGQYMDCASPPWVTTTYRRIVCVLVHWTLHLISYYLYSTAFQWIGYLT